MSEARPFLAAGLSLLLLLLIVARCDHGVPGSSGINPDRDAEYSVPAVSTHGGCLPDLKQSSRLEGAPCCDDEFEFTVEGDSLLVVHEFARYNCCLEEIEVTATIVQSGRRQQILLNEREILGGMGCLCLCYYDVETVVPNLAPGLYLVRYCYWDFGELVCHEGRVLIR